MRGCLSWYESEDGKSPTLADLTSIAPLGYRNELQHARARSTSTVNTRLAGMRSFCGWLVEHRHLRADPSSRLRSIGLQGPPAPKGLTDRQALASCTASTLGVESTVPAVARSWPKRRRGAGSKPLWGSQKGGRLSSQAMRGSIDCLVRAASARGLVPPDASANTLRYTFVMFYLRDNAGDLVGLATLLGHSALDTTRIYGQPTAEMLGSRLKRLSLNEYAE